ncbi:MAG: glycosyltransferase family 1 protein [Candidatus Pacebacteria bacterium]|nr:glycosyltransferase family 1 protein [Candidatus Paceibacterota bacterium]
MKIAIDVRCLTDGRRTGVEEYTLSLLENIFEIDRKNKYVLFLNAWKEPRFDFSTLEKYPNVKLKRLRIPNKLLNFSFWYQDWPKINRLVGGADIVFSPNIIFGAVSKYVKHVTTIHDLSFERYPEYFSQKRRWWHIFINARKICRQANRIIAVSESTKKDVVSLYGIDPQKIAVIPSAVSDKFRIINRNDAKLVKVKEKYNLPYKFILFLGTIEPRKNIVGLVRAFSAFQKFARENKKDDLQKYKLVIAGSSGWKNEGIFQEINNSESKDDIQVINFVDDEDKPYIYNLASLFVYPSFFEGFGFPPLEAMKCGVPVIASNNSSLPEIVGNAGILIDPDKPEEIFRAMREVLSSRELQLELIKKGFEKADQFAWKKTAQKTLEIFETT